MSMPPLETSRLLVRAFHMGDLQAAHHLLDVELCESDMGDEGAQPLEERARWLEWSVLNYEQLAKLHQPPYGDRAIVLKQTGQLIGACGFVPCLNAFEQLPALGAAPPQPWYTSTEFGLFYAVSPAHQLRGYASEAAQALIGYAFEYLRLKRIIATTTYTNEASMGVMRKLGMRIEKNPYTTPPWLQVVGVIEHPSIASKEG